MFIDTTEFSLVQERNEDDSHEEKIEALAEIICQAGDEAVAAMFVLMGTKAFVFLRTFLRPLSYPARALGFQF